MTESSSGRERDHRFGLPTSVLTILLIGLALLAATTVAASALQSADERELIGSNGEVIEIDDGDGTYQVEIDGQQGRLLEKSDELHLRNATVNTESDEAPVVVERARIVRSQPNVYVVQFDTYPLESYRTDIEGLGGTVHGYVPDDAHLIEMSETVAAQVSQLPYVNELLPYEAGLKIEAELDAAVGNGLVGTARYSILLLEAGPGPMAEVVRRLREEGIPIVAQFPETRRLEATLAQTQVDLVLSLDQVEFMDLWTPPEDDVDKVRAVGGANSLETVAGYDGSGVVGAVVDDGLRTDHAQLAAKPPVVISNNSDNDHGTPVYGILFSSGAPDGRYRGVIPEAQGVFASRINFNRPALFSQLTNPSGPYRAVFMTNSWGGGRTQSYTTTSVELDQLIFDYDLLTLQSQSNAGNQDSRPEAWAKNIVSVGAVNHYDTATSVDDRWAGTGSIGPASDGRIKPDLSFWYDETRSISATGSNAYRNFGGTSGATPSTAGYFGLLFEMWADGVFLGTPGLDRDVFDSRPHASTIKALAINTAFEYGFSGINADLTRTHQGWGRIDAQNAYDVAMSGNMPLIVDESSLLRPGQSHTYSVPSFTGSNCVMRTTMVYTDLPGTPSASVHRVNDLSLRVTAPDGTSFWGNNGLRSGNWSTSGGTSNTIDTVENVFLNNVAPGTYTIEVFGDAIVQDSHVETSDLDADYGLVVSGTCLDGPAAPGTNTVIWSDSLSGASNRWSATGGGNHSLASCGYLRTGFGADTVWVSESIDISNFTNVRINAQLSNNGTTTLEASGQYVDTVSLRYQLDGAGEIVAQQATGVTGSTTFTTGGLSGSNLEVRFVMAVTATDEAYCLEQVEVIGDMVAPLPTPTPTATSTATSTPTPTPTATATSTPTATPTSTATSTPTATATPTSTATSTPVPTATPTSTATSTPTATPTATATSTPLPTATTVPTSTPTSTATSTPIPTATTVPTSTPTPTATSTPVPTTVTPVPTPDPNVAIIIAALEDYAIDNGSFRTWAGYKGNGAGWFALDERLNYTTTIASVLVDEGYLEPNDWGANPQAYFVRPCSNGRVAVFTASQAPIAIEDMSNWIGCLSIASRPYFEASRTLSELASIGRANRVAAVVEALEAYQTDNGTFRTPGGYRGNGTGWFAFEGTVNYPTSIASVLIAEGYLVDDGYTTNAREFAVRTCSNGRLAVFARSSVQVDARDALDWAGCTTIPITTGNRPYYEVGRPNAED